MPLEDHEASSLEAMPRRSKRFAVSAEVYTGGANPLDSRHVQPKTEAQKTRILEAINRSFLFNHLEEATKAEIVEAFEEVSVNQGATLITQGEEGDGLYLVEAGSFDVFKTTAPDPESRHVNVMGPGSTVGELALLYSAPRAATVVAREPSVLWRIDREAFSYFVYSAAVQKRDRILATLARVQLLKPLSESQFFQLADAFESARFQPGQLVIAQGDDADRTFFILESGQAQAEKNGKAVQLYVPGDYFGELALLRKEARAASVRATQPAVCLRLGESAFRRLIGPLEALLERNAADYSDVPLEERGL